MTPRVFFPRVPGRDRMRLQWQCPSPRRGRYRFRDLDIGTRSPFGIVEHRVTIPLGRPDRRLSPHRPVDPPMVPDPAPGDREPPRPASRPLGAADGIPRAARLPLRRQPALDPLADLGPSRRAHGQGIRAAERAGPGDPGRPLAAAYQGHATSSGRPSSRRSRSPPRSAWRPAGTRVAASCWAGRVRPRAPGTGPASVKLLHELLEQLAMLRSASEGGLAELLDVLPPVVLREAIIIVVSTRPLNLIEEAERSKRLAGTAARGIAGRISLLNASQGDLVPLFQPSDSTTRNILQHRLGSAIQERLSTHEQHHREAGRRGRGFRPPGHRRTRWRGREGGTSREQLLHLPGELLPDAHGRDHGPERRHRREPGSSGSIRRSSRPPASSRSSRSTASRAAPSRARWPTPWAS